MNLQAPNASEDNPWEAFDQEVEAEYEQSERTLKEVSLMLGQSQTELTRLTQRNANITSHLQQVQAQFDTMPRADIKAAYTAALDIQQRLLVMRGQLDKLQNDEESLNKHISLLEKVRDFLSRGYKPSGTNHGPSVNSATLEMAINAQEAERQRLSRQMHDGPAQALSNFIVQTEIVSRLLDIDQGRAKDEMVNLKSAAMGTFKEVRTFIFELRPMMLDDLGLFPTIKRYVDSFKEQTGSDISLNIKGSERRLQSFLEVMLFRALQELIGNAYRHNEENSVKVQITVNIVLDDNLLKITVSDNGKGFDPEVVEKSGRLGLKLIRERVELLGGYMEIDATVGKGARISFQVPVLDTEE
jgi:two-component system, NarL family, sensor histidine kinase DegS